MTSLTPPQRLRRVAILCCHCLANIAFYRAGWRNGEAKLQDQFWLRVNGNFLDIAVLEWCKLFADHRGKQHWSKVVSDEGAFRQGLLERLSIKEGRFNDYVDEVRLYRDKFVAHLDSELQMHIPSLDIALGSTQYLYDYLLKFEERDNCFSDTKGDSSQLYIQNLDLGVRTYDRRNSPGSG